MCAVAAVVGGLLAAGATVYAADRARSDAAEAREQQERQMQLAKEQAAQAPAASQTTQDVTAAVQSNRRRAAAQAGMSSTITGAGAAYDTQNQTQSGLGYGRKKQLGA